jgi:hypothetical protein
MSKHLASPTNKPWCQDFSASPGEWIAFPTAPAGATIGQASGSVFPFCGPNNSTLNPPISVNGPSATAIYICSTVKVGLSYPFVPNPACPGPLMTKSVTIT